MSVNRPVKIIPLLLSSFSSLIISHLYQFTNAAINSVSAKQLDATRVKVTIWQYRECEDDTFISRHLFLEYCSSAASNRFALYVYYRLSPYSFSKRDKIFMVSRLRQFLTCSKWTFPRIRTSGRYCNSTHTLLIIIRYARPLTRSRNCFHRI